MVDLITHWFLTWSVALYVALALGIAGLVAAWFLRWPVSIAAGCIGLLALGAAAFLAGYQAADDRAAHRRQIEAMRAENDRLSRDLMHQKDIAELAEMARSAALVRLADRNAKVAEYETRLASEKPQVVQACSLTAADIRALRGLRAK